MRILLIEDEKDLADNLKRGLEEEGYAVDVMYNGEEGSFKAETENYDVIILDVMLPKKDGLQVCKGLRALGNATPILMLTARSAIENKIEGLEVGADDYLTKPFSTLELYARVKTLLRRSGSIEQNKIEVDNMAIDLFKHEVTRNGEKVSLSPKEFAILELLARNREGVVSRTSILEHAWDSAYEGDSNIVDVMVGTLRRKVDCPPNKKLIQTVYGVGFKLSANESK